ncbi:unnamed protein product [Hyaloperonospora brassicae]|uniref:Uncharacterized protein n=1 Tax=Hyaloperonospora brassicae TaxID=162125 RepID=A0AAV0TRX9_HYABA|nr:unnamed protein product [Hyaloperonospora brassicae]
MRPQHSVRPRKGETREQAMSRLSEQHSDHACELVWHEDLRRPKKPATKRPKKTDSIGSRPMLEGDKTTRLQFAFYPVVRDFDVRRLESAATIFDVDMYNWEDVTTILSNQCADAIEGLIGMDAGHRCNSLVMLKEHLRRVAYLMLSTKLASTGSPAQTCLTSQWHSLLRLVNDIELPAPLVEVIDLFGNFETPNELWRLSGLPGKVTELIWNAHLTVRPRAVLVIDRSSVAALSDRYMSQLVAQPIMVTTADGDDAMSLRLAPTFDLNDATAVDAFAVLLEGGTNVGQRDEFVGRHRLYQFFVAGVFPDTTQQRKQLELILSASLALPSCSRT